MRGRDTLGRTAIVVVMTCFAHSSAVRADAVPTPFDDAPVEEVVDVTSGWEAARPWVAAGTAAAGAGIAYGGMALLHTAAFNGSNPINSLLYHPDEPLLWTFALMATPFAAGAGATFLLLPVVPASRALLVGSFTHTLTMAGHLLLWLAWGSSISPIDAPPIELEIPLLVTVGALAATTAGAGAFILASDPALDTE
jgi:hypothetical protein